MVMVEVPPDTHHTLSTTEKTVVYSTTWGHPVEMVVCLVVLSSVSSFFLSVLLEVPLHSSRRSLEVMLIRRNHLSMKKVPWHKKFIYLFINSRSKIVYRLDLYSNFIYREYAQIGLDNNIINCLHCTALH